MSNYVLLAVVARRCWLRDLTPDSFASWFASLGLLSLQELREYLSHVRIEEALGP